MFRKKEDRTVEMVFHTGSTSILNCVYYLVSSSEGQFMSYALGVGHYKANIDCHTNDQILVDAFFARLVVLMVVFSDNVDLLSS